MGVLDNDTILMVFGDHGMTRSGDHGGDSEDELQAGLFVYSRTKLFSRTLQANEQVVSQTDIVPTLSLLLGLPVPFSNLGIIIPSLFEDSGLQNIPENSSKLHALLLNALQVHRYIKEYTQLSNDISANALNAIANPLFQGQVRFSDDNNTHFGNDTITRNEISQEEKAYLSYLKEIRELCRTVWAKFDIPVIQIGIFIAAVSCVMSFVWILMPELFLDGHESQKPYKHVLFASLIIFILGCLLFYGCFSMFLMVFVICGITGFVLKFHKNIFGYIKQYFAEINLKEVIVVLLFFIQFAGFFSNSYVINEDKILLFFLQTVFLVLVVIILTNSIAAGKLLELEDSKGYLRAQKRKEKKKRGFIWSCLEDIRPGLACLFLLMILFRLGSLFWPCREEQAGCETTKFVSASEQNGYQLWLGCMFLLLVPAFLIFRLRVNGNLNGYSSPVLAVKYALPFGAVFASLHWLLQYVPAKMVEENPAIGFIQQILTPCILYCCCLGALCCLLYQPITAFVVRPRDLEDGPAISTDQRSMKNAVVQIFKRLRSELSETDNDEDIPYVYGLGTAYSSAVLVLVVCLAMPVAIVLGDGLGPSVTFMIAQVYLFLELDRMKTSQEAAGEQMSFGM